MPGEAGPPGLPGRQGFNGLPGSPGIPGLKVGSVGFCASLLEDLQAGTCSVLEVMWAALVLRCPLCLGWGEPYAQVSLAHLVQDSRFPGCLHLQLRFTPPRDGLRPQRAGFSQHCSKSIQTPLTTLSHHIAPRDPLATSSCCAPGLMPLGAWLPNPGPSLPALGPPAWRWGAVLHPHV